SIEILRGAGSAIHGSEALGGVVAINTPDPTHETRIDAEASGGSFDTWAGGAAIGGSLGQGARARLSINHFRTEGENAARTGTEKDGTETTNANGKAIVDLGSQTRVTVAGRFATTETEVDDFRDIYSGGFGVTDANFINEMDAVNGRAQLDHELVPDQWVVSADAEASRATLDFFDDSGFERGTRGDRQKYGGQITHFFHLGSVTARLENEKQSFTNIDTTNVAANQSKDKQATSYSAEAQLFPSDVLSLQLGIRHDNNDSFDDATTWRASGAWDIHHIQSVPFTLHASAGTGLRDPSFTETFGFFPDQFVGNPSLKPEHAYSREIGISGSMHDGALNFDVTAFWLDIEDLIKTNFFCAENCADMDFMNDVYYGTPVNQPSKAKSHGIEATVNATLQSGIMLAGHYSYMESKQANNQDQLRRPGHTASANVTVPFQAERGLIDFSVDYTGEQKDGDFITYSGTPFTLEAYWLANIAVQYAVNDKIALFAKADNLLDEEYEDVFTYNAPGRSLFAGVRAKLGN
ncbi:MAG: TonB-dependent receptor plug domain-containing protein, partial [Alphaproteobacteria bacterium]